jgi:hypothetical protein
VPTLLIECQPWSSTYPRYYNEVCDICTECCIHRFQKTVRSPGSWTSGAVPFRSQVLTSSLSDCPWWQKIRYMGLKWLHFATNKFSSDMKSMINTRWLANLNQGSSDFPYKFWSLYEYVSHSQVKIHVLMKWSYIVLPLETRKPSCYLGAKFSITWHIGPLCHNEELCHENTH